jgi:hypothetical protein
LLASLSAVHGLAVLEAIAKKKKAIGMPSIDQALV